MMLYSKWLVKHGHKLLCGEWWTNNQRGENKWSWLKRLAGWWSCEDQDREKESAAAGSSLLLKTDVSLRLIFPLRAYSSVLSPPSAGDFMPSEQLKGLFFPAATMPNLSQILINDIDQFCIWDRIWDRMKGGSKRLRLFLLHSHFSFFKVQKSFPVMPLSDWSSFTQLVVGSTSSSKSCSNHNGCHCHCGHWSLIWWVAINDDWLFPLTLDEAASCPFLGAQVIKCTLVIRHESMILISGFLEWERLIKFQLSNCKHYTTLCSTQPSRSKKMGLHLKSLVWDLRVK